MTAANLPGFFPTPKIILTQFLQGVDAAGTYKTLFTGAAAGSKIVALRSTLSDSATPHLVTIQRVRGGIFFGGFALTIPLSSGFTAGALPVNILQQWPGLAFDNDGNPFIFLEQNDLLQATFATALQAASVLNIDGEAANGA